MHWNLCFGPPFCLIPFPLNWYVEWFHSDNQLYRILHLRWPFTVDLCCIICCLMNNINHRLMSQKGSFQDILALVESWHTAGTNLPWLILVFKCVNRAHIVPLWSTGRQMRNQCILWHVWKLRNLFYRWLVTRVTKSYKSSSKKKVWSYVVMLDCLRISHIL